MYFTEELCLSIYKSICIRKSSIVISLLASLMPLPLGRGMCYSSVKGREPPPLPNWKSAKITVCPLTLLNPVRLTCHPTNSNGLHQPWRIIKRPPVGIV